MNDRKNTRAVELGKYIAQTQCTVRDAAKRFEIGKSTVHKDVTERLPHLDGALFEKVRKILDYNLSVRHLRGGEATKNKCEARKCDGNSKDKI
ncbi:MAG: sporulation transcriptional regulator SpoIIID [Clostridiales bacterium]|nr:sporulation transcriptional regulator SpoIIID [Clostridiales bacterium]